MRLLYLYSTVVSSLLDYCITGCWWDFQGACHHRKLYFHPRFALGIDCRGTVLCFGQLLRLYYCPCIKTPTIVSLVFHHWRLYFLPRFALGVDCRGLTAEVQYCIFNQLLRLYYYIFTTAYIKTKTIVSLRWGWIFFERTRILCGIQFRMHFIEIFVVETKRFVGSTVMWSWRSKHAASAQARLRKANAKR